MRTNQKNSSELKSRSALGKNGKQNSTLPKIDFNRRNWNRHLPKQTILELLKNDAPQLWSMVEVVGDWLWLKFSTRQPSTITAYLSECGFSWNKTRQLWQHRGDTETRLRRRRFFIRYFPADLTHA